MQAFRASMLWVVALLQFYLPGWNNAGPLPAATEWGLGLGPLSQKTIRNGRMFADSFDIFTSRHNNDLLSEREDNEAYALANPGQQYAVYFPDGGEVIFDVSAFDSAIEVRWLDIENSSWQEPQQVENSGSLILQAPGDGDWIAVIR